MSYSKIETVKNENIENTHQNIANQLENRMKRLSSSVTTSTTMTMANLLRNDLLQSKKTLDNQEKSTNLPKSAEKKLRLSTLSANKSSRNDLQNISSDSESDIKNSARSSNSILCFSYYIIR